MRIKDAVASAPFPRGDAEIILAHLYGKPRTWIVAHGDHMLAPEKERQWIAFRRRREQGEPVAYITGEKEFFGRPFHIDRSVLIPRPSTEGLVEMALDMYVTLRCEPSEPRRATRKLDTGIVGIAQLFPRKQLATTHSLPTIVDIGTGSGCIAITLACELPEISIIATDTSAAALNIARMNAKRHGVGERIQFLQGSLLEPLCHPNPFLLVSNPPYIPEQEALPRDVAAYEPSMALRAGPGGLAVIRPLLAAARSHPACMGFVIECRADQIDEKATEDDDASL